MFCCSPHNDLVFVTNDLLVFTEAVIYLFQKFLGSLKQRLTKNGVSVWFLQIQFLPTNRATSRKFFASASYDYASRVFHPHIEAAFTSGHVSVAFVLVSKSFTNRSDVSLPCLKALYALVSVRLKSVHYRFLIRSFHICLFFLWSSFKRSSIRASTASAPLTPTPCNLWRGKLPPCLEMLADASIFVGGLWRSPNDWRSERLMLLNA